MDQHIYTPPTGPPQISAPQFYDRIGLDRLYDLAWRQYQQFPETRIASMFPQDEKGLKEASEKQAEFMAGVMGGPRIYIEKHGPPRMRARHFPFAIDASAREIWLDCYLMAFAQCGGLGLNQEDQKTLLEWVKVFSAWMVNRPG